MLTQRTALVFVSLVVAIGACAADPLEPAVDLTGPVEPTGPVDLTPAAIAFTWYDDFDADGVPDSRDNCRRIDNAAQLDADGDGIGDGCDLCPDLEGMGGNDQDNDGLGDACDPDRDGDGALDVADNCPAVYNAGQRDIDLDGLGDLCDTDDDGDGISDESDDCPAGPSLCFADTDNDGFDDVIDNCPGIANPLQVDIDSDRRGDLCDEDADGDGVYGSHGGGDNCFGVPNPDQVDIDHDGRGDDGQFVGGPGSCDGRECYVVGEGIECLDPSTVMMATALFALPAEPARGFAVGGTIGVHVFSNRLDREHTWAATLVAPDGSESVLSRATGASTTHPHSPQVTSCAQACDDSGSPRFVPDRAGAYEISVVVELVGGNSYLDVAESTVSIVVGD